MVVLELFYTSNTLRNALGSQDLLLFIVLFTFQDIDGWVLDTEKSKIGTTTKVLHSNSSVQVGTGI